MAKMTIRVILKSGAEFSIKCDKFTLSRNGLEQVTGYDIKGISENKPVYLDFAEVAAVVRVFSDEHAEAGEEPEAATQEEKPKYTDTKIPCPHCGGDNKNAILCADTENKEFFVYCQTCGIETIDTFKSKAKAIKAFTDGKTRSITGSEGDGK